MKVFFTLIFSLAVLITHPLFAMNESEFFTDPAKTYTMPMKLPQKWLEAYDPSELACRTCKLREQSRYSYTSKIITETEIFTLNVYTYSNTQLTSLTSKENYTLNVDAHSHKAKLLNSLNPDTEVVFTPLKEARNEENEEISAEFIFLIVPKGYYNGEEG